MLAEGFSSIEIVFSLRESNLVAHMLASKAEDSMSTVWHEDPPDFIRDLLVNDVTLLDV